MVNIAEKRKARRLTQAELAQMLGVSQRAVAAWELRERRPSVPMARQLGAVLDFDWPEIYEEDENDEQVGAGG